MPQFLSKGNEILRTADSSGQQDMQLTKTSQIAATPVTQLWYGSLRQDHTSARDVVVKIITLSAIENNYNFDHDAIRKRLAILQSLRHPHIFPILDAKFLDSECDRIQLILPTAAGTLADQLPETGLSLTQVQRIFTQIAQVLQHAHNANILHLNLKPQNILFDDAGNACLSDFCCISTSDEDQRVIFATPAYLAPEQIIQAPLAVQTDVYALGCLLYAMLTGLPPFSVTQALHEVAVLQHQLHSEPVPPSHHNGALPKTIDSVLKKALAKAPQDRYASVAQFEEALSSAIDHPNKPPLYTPHSRITVPPIIRPFIITFFFLAIALFTLLISQGTQNEGGAPARKEVSAPQILFGEISSADDLVVSEDEIDLAQAALGVDGFIAYITCNRTSEYYATIAREVATSAELTGLPLTVYDGQNDEFRQPILIEQARVDGAVAFIVCPLNMDVLEEQLEALAAEDIPLVLTAGTVQGAVTVNENDALLGAPIGRYAGEYIRDEMGGQAHVIVLNYPSLPNIAAREQAMIDGLLEIAPDAEIIARFPGGTRDLGYDSTHLLLETNTMFNVILSINDAGAYGAIDALEEAGVSPNAVSIFSVDAELRARQYIAQNYFLRASIGTRRMSSARATLNSTIKLLAGSPVAETIEISPGDVMTSNNVD